MIATKKGFFKKIGAGLMVLAAMAPIALGMTSMKSVSATETTPPSEVTVNLHKTVDGGPINNTGNILEGYTPYSPDRYGNIQFTLYNVDDLYDKWKSAGDYTDDAEAFNAFKDDLMTKIQGNTDTTKEQLANQKTWLDANTDDINEIANISSEDNATPNIFKFNSVTNSGKYLALETYANDESVLGISVPVIFSLPIHGLDKANSVHLYPKNNVKDADPELIKHGKDWENVSEDVKIQGVTFKLIQTDVDPEKEIDIASTDKDGNIKIPNLAAGTYSLRETDAADYYAKIDEINFTVDAQGHITLDSNAPKGVELKNNNGTYVFEVENFLTLGNEDFVKVDGKNTKIELEGAEFFVRETNDKDTARYAVFKDGKFARWTSDESEATTITSGAKGSFSVNGMPYKGTSSTFYLEETKAPDGYELREDLIPFTISKTSGTYEKTQNVKNNKYELPTTGGMGIWLFVLIGAALMGGSGYYYYKSRKNKLAE